VILLRDGERFQLAVFLLVAALAVGIVRASSGNGRRLAIGALALLATLWLGREAGPATARYLDHRFVDQAAWREIERLSQVAATVVAYVGYSVPYPYYGSALQNRVEFVPTRGSLEDRFYSWGSRPNRPFGGDDELIWRENLKQLNVALVVVEKRERYRRALAWIRDDSQAFELVLAEGDVEIWRVTNAARRTP
jgi:hypothetical protein